MHRFVVYLATAFLIVAVATGAAAQSVTRSTFKVIGKVQELMEEERFDEALAQLEILVEQTRDIPYDHAIANQFLAHNSVMLDKIPRARAALKAAVATPDLPPVMAMELRLFYGSVLLGEEEYGLASEMLESWLALAPKPKPGQVFKVGYANYMNGALARAEELLQRAVNEGGSKAEDSWLQVYYRVLFDMKRYKQGEAVLYRLIERAPGKPLPWRMLASHHLQLDKSDDALAAMMVSYLGGQIEDGDDLKQIVSLFSFLDVPDKAARLLEAWIADGRVEKDAKTAKQLGNLWLIARERAKAKVALREAAEIAPDSDIYEMLGGVHFEDEEWRAAHGAYRQALRMNAEEPDRISLLAGISAFRAGLFEEAQVALTRVEASAKYGEQAKSLLAQIDESRD